LSHLNRTRRKKRGDKKGQEKKGQLRLLIQNFAGTAAGTKGQIHIGQFSLAGTTVEDLTLTGTEDLDGTGNDLDNLITGNTGINRLEGGSGTDYLIAGLGNESIADGLLGLALTR
jgi:Ca2+-binding RTX toxin-like protein